MLQIAQPILQYAPEGMQQRLRESYMEMASTNQGRVSPVEVAWKRVREDIQRLSCIHRTRPPDYGKLSCKHVYFDFQKSCDIWFHR